MTEFAMSYFRQPKTSDFGSLTLNRKRKEWTWQELSDKVKYTNKPISHSLIRLENNETDKLAVDMFASVMRYMGDLSLKRGQTMTDCVYEILSACHNYPALIDEIYCQVIKQTTTNKSSKAESLLLGWRLFTILTAYFASTQTLQPFLIKYLNEIANDPRRPFNGTASLCLLNYQQTLKFGGRKFILTAAEVEAITSGKNVKRQAFELPGGQKRFISTKTITVAEEVIKELCTEMNVWSDAEQHEFALCYILEKDSTLRVLSNDEYILDITSELETRNEKFILILTRTVWIHPMREDNDLYIDVLFFQVVPNYMAGLLTIMPMNNSNQLSAKTLDDAAALAALLFMASTNDPESFNETLVQTIVPRTVLERANLSASNWFDRIKQKLAVFPKHYYGNIARLEFLKFVEKWPLYGSSFYFVNKCKFAEKTFKNPVVAVNKDGVKILSSTTMETLWNCKLNDIRSSRKYSINGNGILDVNIVQDDKKIPEAKLSIDTDSGSEIARVIGQYVYLNNQKAQYIVNSRNSKQA
uniref:MyTH4 domain-containing protein n=1 Tax=Panagrolaimus sp. ES5 TaxID=591445 RepID=A0AC34F7I7_9BILA